MKQSLKNQKGIAFIAIILIIIVAVAAGGATYLGVRMVVTGEEFLAPFEELGWIDSDNKKDKDEDDDDDDNNKSSSIEVSSKAKKSGVTHYEISLDWDKVVDVVEAGVSMALSFSDSYYDDTSSSETEEYLEVIKEVAGKVDFSADLYAKADEVVEIDVYLNFKDALKEVYNYAVKNSLDMGLDELDSLDEYDSFDDFYKEFEKEYLKEYLDSDYIVDLITDEIDLSELGITSSDIEDALEIKSSDGTISIQFAFSDDMNESIKEAIEDNIDEINSELSSELESVGIDVEIDPDTYVEDAIELIENIIDKYGELVSSYDKNLGEAIKGIVTIKKVK